jgi:hypothetical protein
MAIHALFSFAFRAEPNDGESYPYTREQMREIVYEAIDSGWDIPLPVYVDDFGLTKIDAYIESVKIPEDAVE